MTNAVYLEVGVLDLLSAHPCLGAWRTAFWRIETSRGIRLAFIRRHSSVAWLLASLVLLGSGVSDLGLVCGNVDSSFVVDYGMACRCMVKYASKGE